MDGLFSYDTEALNKKLLQIEEEAEQLFVNQFGNTDHKKTTLGVQQLYLVGIIFETHYFFNDMLIGFSFFYRTL